MPFVQRSHLKALLKKNWIVWRRSLITSILEILLPILLMVIVVIVRKKVDPQPLDGVTFTQDYYDTASEQSESAMYLTYPFYNKTTNITQIWKNETQLYSFFDVPAWARYYFYPGKCMKYETKRNFIGLSPKNNITMEIEKQLNNWMLQWRASYGYYLSLQAKYFDTEEDMMAFVSSDDYEMNDKVRGLCAGISYHSADNGNSHYIKLHFDDQSESNKNQNIPSQMNPSYDPFQRDPLIAEYKMYAQEGFNFYTNWIANTILRTTTDNSNATIVSLTIPMHSNASVLDQFTPILQYLLPLCMVLMYIMPINRTVSRIVNEKETRARESMRIMGLTDSAYWLSWFIYYIIVSSIIALVSSQVLCTNVFMHSNKFLIFIYFWFFGFSLFGYVVFIQAFFSRARTAAIISCLVYFFTSFADYAVQNKYLMEPVKTFASILPTIGMRRAIFNIGDFEVNGTGLNYENFSAEYYNYKVSTCIWMFVISFFAGTFIGIYLTNVLPVENGLRLPWNYMFKRRFWVTENVIRSKQQYFSKDQINREDLDDSEQIDEEFEVKGNKKMPTENYEKIVRQDLLKQENENKILKITNLKKSFGDFNAVNNLNLKMFNGQIFALLGHNGAGKTTTISMLTGILEATAGSAEVFGKDLFGGMEDIRKFMGVCPQHDILFDQLTPIEHLEIFCDFKGVNSKTRKKDIEQMLIDVDLAQFKNTIAKNLSGGSKRKLSVAIALIGDSKFVLLDEPTAGMDLTARRKLWNMLKDYKHNRIIILTTHYMDEADILGDRIGIMSGGQLICLGGSLFLKNRFGVGYNLTMVKNTKEPNTKAENYLYDKLGEVKKLSEISSEITFQIPLTLSHKFKDFFDDFDLSLPDLDIRSYGISVTTLEEVFLRVSLSEKEERAEIKQFEEVQLSRDSNKVEQSPSMTEENAIEDYTIAETQEQGGWNLFRIHMGALFRKRYQQYRRNYRGFFAEILVPVLLVVLGFAFSKTQYYYNSPEREMSPSMLPLRQRLHVNDRVYKNSSFDITPQQLIENLPDYDTAFTPEYKDYSNLKTSFLQTQSQYILSMFDQYVYSNQEIPPEDPTRYGAYFIYEANNQTKQFKVVSMVNITSQDSAGLYPTWITESVLRLATGNDQLKFKVINSPFPVTKRYKAKSAQVDGMFIVFVIAIGFALIPSSVVSYILHEREKNLKHMQWISGLNMGAYWVSNYLFDLAKAYIPVCLVIALLYIFGLNYDYVWINFLMYPLAVVPFTYCTSFLFTSELVAQTVTVFVHFVCSGVFGIIVLLLRVIEQTYDLGDILLWVFKIIPSFCLTNSVMFMASKSRLSSAREDLDLEPFAMQNLKGDLIIMAIHFIFWTMVLVILEGGLIKYCKKATQIILKKQIKPKTDLVLDEDVIEEENRISNYLKKQEEGLIKSEDQMQVMVHKFRKVYTIQNCKQRLAVENSSFGLDFGECFALLGVNGAGKTTTFKSLTNDILPTSGLIKINGKDTRKQFNEIRKMIGYCPQHDCIFDLLTVEEHLHYYALIKGIEKNKRKVLIEKQIKEMNLEEHRRKPAGTLSGGNKRKLSVALAVLGNPPIILLDEPSAGMDPKARRFMWSIVEKISQQRKKSAVILTTHSMEEAEALSTKMGIMVKGGIFRCFGSSQHIKNKFGTGYEIELKVHKTSQDEYDRIYAEYGFKQDQHMIELGVAIDMLKIKGALAEEVKADGLGQDLYKEAQESSTKMILVKNLVDWIYIQHYGTQLIKRLVEVFKEVEVLEHYNDYYKVRVPKLDKSIGFVFGLIENNKDSMRIHEYSVSQTTLEQIFQNFASQTTEMHSLQGIVFYMDSNQNLKRKELVLESAHGTT